MDAVIGRDLRGAAAESHDLLVIGGGIYGITLALAAARRGLKTLLLEKADFGGATTWNSLRIVHGGLRYLQTLDVARHRESVAERRWFLHHFPDLVEPLPCLMPLYDPPRGGQLRRPALFRAALAADALLSRDGSQGGLTLPPGRVLGTEETAALFPAADRAGLRGSALWHDAVVPDSHRLVIELLRWACRCGARALNYVEAGELRVEGGEVRGLRVLDRESGRGLELKAKAVANCAGPWVRHLARRFDRDRPELFRPLLAFNLLLDREPLSRGAVAVAPPGPGARTCFLLPWKGKVLAGTAYAPSSAEALRDPAPGENQVGGFLRELNAAVPGLEARSDQILRVLWGGMPASGEGSTVPASRPVIWDHSRNGGPRGLVSVSGVKLTTARAVAEKTLALLEAGGQLRPTSGPVTVERPESDPPLALEELSRLAEEDWSAAQAHLRGLVERQAVVRLEDLLLRRTDWGIDPGRAEAAARLCESLGWRGSRPPMTDRRATGGRIAG